MKSVTFDVMLNDRFVCTLHMPITLDIVEEYDGDKPIISITSFRRFVENKRPSLKGKP